MVVGDVMVGDVEVVEFFDVEVDYFVWLVVFVVDDLWFWF